MTTVILLAAGSSNRMGEKNKLLLPFNEQSMISHVSQHLQESGLQPIIAVLGHQQELIKPILSSLSIETVYNPDHKLGMVGSIKCGVSCASADSSRFMIVLGDLPLLKADHYRSLITFALEQKDGSIIRPISDTKELGHPVIFDAFYKEEILNCVDPDSLKEVVKNNKTAFVPYITSDRAYFTDMDTQREYEKLIL